VLFLVLVVALAMVGIGSALWFQLLSIDGVVQTGDVAAQLSVESVVENDDDLPDEKNVADCDAVLNATSDGLEVTIGGAYPSYECWVEFDVHSIGSVPVHIYHPTWTTLPPPEAVTFSLLGCYEEDTQIHEGEKALCTLYLHVEQEADQNARYVFEGFVDARQFNEPRDAIVDADGTLTRFSGNGFAANIQVAPGDTLTAWPTGGFDEGLDWFDTDGTCTWTFGDDLHAEGSAHPTAIRDGWHDDFLDPLVLDWDWSLDMTPGAERVDVDLETGSTFTGCAGPDSALMFFDANGDTYWNDGEDIVLDTNGNGVFDA